MNRHSSVRRALLAAAVSTALALAACGGDSGPGTGEVTILHLATTTAAAGEKRILASTSAAPIPAGVDSMQVQFFDSTGQSVLDPVEVPVAPQVRIQNVPLTATSITVAYLQNGGFAVAKDDEPIAWNGAAGTSSPVPAAVSASASATSWKTSMENGLARVTLTSTHLNGGSPTPILLKGVAYSPAPIGSTNKKGPGIGDLFWDTPNPDWFIDWDKVWKRDIEVIRGKGFNAVRTYSLIAKFMHDSGAIPTKAQVDDNTSANLLNRNHRKFLDAAWNNGLNPVYVLAGVPMPPEIWSKDLYDCSNCSAVAKAENDAKKYYWEKNFEATVKQLADHPAVIGFTMFNEQGDAGALVNAPEGAYSIHYWTQVKKYSEMAKQFAPTKLVGWAYFDNPPFAKGTIQKREQYAKSVDFYGVNAFQPEQVADSLDPYKQSVQGAAARPVFLTEFGMPATGHRNNSTDPSSIYSDTETVQKAANSMAKVVPLALAHPAVAGMFYFEWNDEWWKQDGGSDFKQDGGTVPNNYPNGFPDEEGYGLNSIALGARQPDQVYTDKPWGTGGNVQVDILTPRTALMDVLVNAYKAAEANLKTKLGIN